MNTQLPTHLGGLQHLAPEVIVEVGDILVRDGKPMDMITAADMATSTAGMTVREAESISGMNIYRRIPCPRQGGERMESELGAILRDTGKIKEEIFQNLVKQTEGDIAAHNEVARKQEEAVQAIVNGGAGVKAATYDDGKPPLASLPPEGILAVARVQAYGKKKYGDDENYRRGMEAKRQMSCVLRHVFKYLAGEDNDKESGEPHLAHAATRLLFAIQNIAEGTMIDDRYKNR